MVKRVGVWKLAATVWPTSTLLDTTIPFTGETMRVYLRFVSDSVNAASAWAIWAFETLTCAFAVS